MVMTDRRLTADEYLALPLEDRHTQLIDGEIVVTDARLRHQRIVLELARLLANWLLEHPGLGEAGIGCNWRLDDRNVFVPDVWFLREERLPSGETLAVDGPPDLAVEVRSPMTWHYDVGRKNLVYERTGLPELWLVDTESNTVLVFRRSVPDVAEFDVALEVGAGEEVTTPLLLGLALDLAALFDR
jgi:Uma2 family endonuclease